MGFAARAVPAMKSFIINRKPVRLLAIACLLLLVGTGYASSPEPVHNIEEGDFRDRIQSARCE